MWVEVFSIQETRQNQPSSRARRGWLFGQWVPGSGDAGAGAGAGGYGATQAPAGGYSQPPPPPAAGGYGAPVVNPTPDVGGCKFLLRFLLLLPLHCHNLHFFYLLTTPKIEKESLNECIMITLFFDSVLASFDPLKP